LIEANGFASSVEDSMALANRICIDLVKCGLDIKSSTIDSEPCLLDKSIQLSQKTKSQISTLEQSAIDKLWGFDKIRVKKNNVIEVTEAGSAKYERHAEKEQKKWLDELEAKFIGVDDDLTKVSTMTLPDYSENKREKDIQVSNFNLTFGNQLLLENADLRLISGRKYGLVGRYFSFEYHQTFKTQQLNLYIFLKL
jgi:hypothetical protein